MAGWGLASNGIECQSGVASINSSNRRPQIDRTPYGLDIAKNAMQLHWVEAETGEIGRKKLARAKLAEYFAQLRPARVVMEACGSAHHWARVLPAHTWVDR